MHGRPGICSAPSCDRVPGRGSLAVEERCSDGAPSRNSGNAETSRATLYSILNLRAGDSRLA
jgi:hypothetical protein